MANTAKTEVEKTLEKLVSFKSVSGDRAETQRLLDYAKKELSSAGMHVEQHASNGYLSLIALSQTAPTPAKKYNRKLWLVGHIDVVPAPDAMFSVTYTDDKMFGRGVLDDKMAAAGFIDAVKKLDSVGEYDFGVMLTGDEEVGGANGVSYLLNHLPIKGEAAFVPDSGENWGIETNAKGGFHFTVIANGVAAHGSRPWKGENAIDKLYQFIEMMRKDLGIVDPETAKRDYLRTLNLGVIQGGKVANQVPERAEAKIDIRFPKLEDQKEIQTYLDKVNAGDNGSEIANILIVDPTVVNPDDPWIKKTQDILKSFDIKSVFRSETGATDARFFVKKGIPPIITRPGGDHVHSDDEWLDRKGLELLPKLVLELIKQTAK
jgi:succinyl-diaminopimelate desuccinylase